MIPRANPPSIEARSRIYRGEHATTIDMNRSWSGSVPSWRASRAIWKIIEEVDADIVVDLHSSNGIYGKGGVGQCIFPTPNSRTDAQVIKRRINRELITPDLIDKYGMEIRYSVGNNQTGANPLLSHMVGRERPETKGYLLEPWRIPHLMEPRVEWNTVPTIWLLEREGMRF